MKVILERAEQTDAATIAEMRVAVAERLTKDFGEGPWSAPGTIKGVLYAMRHSNVFVCRRRGKIVGVVELGIKKPWAIDKSYFTACNRPLYLTGMAVTPEHQRNGLGRAMLAAVEKLARRWPADAIRLDAYDATAGAGGFYAKCGFREMGRVTYRNTPLTYHELLLPSLKASDKPARISSRS